MTGLTGTARPALARALACIAGLCAVLAMSAPARADIAMTSLPRNTPISAYKGTIAWSRWDSVKFEYRLVLTTIKTGKTTSASTGARSAPFDATLGPDTKGKTVALYSRCHKSDGTDCDAYRYDLAKKKESKLDFSRDDRDEVWPSQWEGRFAWVEQRGKGDDYADFKDGNCDAPLTRPVDPDEAVKELSKGTCGMVTGQVLRKTTIAQTVTYSDQPADDGAARKYSEVRVLATKGGKGKRLGLTKYSGDGTDIYASPTIDDKYVYVVRHGVGVSSKFVRLDRTKGKDPKPREVEAQTPLAGWSARDGGTTLYVEQLPGDPGAPLTPCSTIRPCRMVRADPSVFGSAERKLAPRLTFQPPPDVVFANRPLPVSGSLSVPVVREGRLVRGEPVPGATLEGLLATNLNNANAESLRPTGRTATTGADGAWALVVPLPIPLLGYYAAITRGLAIPAQSPVVKLKSYAFVSLTAANQAGGGVSFSGTVDPAQPGRLVRIQKRLEGSATPLTVAETTVGADGFFGAGATATAGASYFAELPGNPFDGADGDATITGISVDVQATPVP